MSDVTFEEALARLSLVFSHSVERNVRGIAEEAGEVVGAFNKMDANRTDKPKTVEDVIEEIAQLITCCYILGKRLGVEPAKLTQCASEFAISKAFQLEQEEQEQ